MLKRKSVMFPIMLMMMLAMTSLFSLVAAEEKIYVLRASVDPAYEMPPAGHFNIFAPKCILPSGTWTRGFVLEQLAKYWYLNNSYSPWLAESWEETPEGLLVHLRRYVRWSDGMPFTAKDVVATFYCLHLTKHVIWTYITDVIAIDDFTVLFKTDNPKNPIVVYYALINPIVPYHQYGKFADKCRNALKTDNKTLYNEAFNELQNYRPEKMIGTGAYEIESVSMDQIVLKKREDYWGLRLGFTKGIYFDKVTLMNHPPDPQIAQMEIADQCDIEYHGGAVLGQVYAAPRYINCTFAAYPSPSGTATFFNLHKYPFTLKEFRQAIAYAINISKAMLSVYSAYSKIPEDKLTGFDIPTMFSYFTQETWAKLKSYSYNPQKAEEILKSLGFKRGPDGVWVSPNGTRCEFEMIIHSGWGSGRVNTYLAQQLTEFGIKVNVKAIEPATVSDFLIRSEFEISSQYWGGVLPYFCAAVWTRNWLPTVVVPPGPSVGFPTVYEWEGKLVNVTELTLKMNVVDEATRKEIINLLALIFNEYLPFIQHYPRPGGPLFINFEHIDWPLPYKPQAKGKYKFPCPLIEAEDCAEWTYPFDQSLPFIVIKGLVKPKGLIVEQPTFYSYVTVYAKVEIPTFIGIDGREYGPYGVGSAIVVPKEDADRLVSEGKASYTPILPGLEALAEKLLSLEEKIKALEEAQLSLKSSMADLSSVISSIVILEAVVIIVLAAGLIISLALSLRRSGSR